MTRKSFSAEDWFKTEPDLQRIQKKSIEELTPESRLKARFPTFTPPSAKQAAIIEDCDRFSPLNCFTPGWRGDSLLSKGVVKFRNLLRLVSDDVRNELLKSREFPKTIKLGIHNEFLSFVEGRGLVLNKMDDIGSFWQMIHSEEGNEEKILQEFLQLYCARVAVINFLKLRFIGALVKKAQLEMTDKALLYPTSFLSQVFKKGSKLELKSRAFESNLYSWYKPRTEMKTPMNELLGLGRELTVCEIIKNVSLMTMGEEENVYSHALSHVGVGLFLNSLQINFPMWLEALEGSILPRGGLEQQKIISCKYFGDFLESLSLSHWLAQDNNKDFRWDEMLCPDFKGLEFTSGTFAKICNELHFLTFLANKAEHENEETVDYICKITGGHFRNRKGGQSKSQLSLEDNPFYSSTYDRVVLNLCLFPKNNPQHYLIHQITDQAKYLKQGGYLFVLSSKKLFVPSLRDRLDGVLEEFKTEAIFDLEDVKGKGELGNYIYVFRKKMNHQESEKQTCAYFRISADLQNFAQFASVTEHLRSFYLANLGEFPPMAQLEFSDSFRVEFYQEAISHGMLIHSASEDSTRITHPAYFRSLLQNCVPLEGLFDIKAITSESNKDSLSLNLDKDQRYFVLVDFRAKEPELSLHPMDTYRSILGDFGQTQCFYFELTPKLPGLNPNILRNYFLTTVGRQVGHLTFSQGPLRVKSSLRKFFIPKFLTQTESFPEHFSQGFQIFDLTEEELLDCIPENLFKAYNHIDQITRDLFPRFACQILTKFTTLERTLSSLLWRMQEGSQEQKMSFNNPMVQASLAKLPTRPLYPENEEIYLEFVETTTPQDLHLPLTESEVIITHEGDLRLYALELSSNQRVIVRLHAEESLILFVQFLTSHAQDVPLSTLLKAIHVPSLADLQKILERSGTFKDTFETLHHRVQKSISEAFRYELAPKSP